VASNPAPEPDSSDAEPGRPMFTPEQERQLRRLVVGMGAVLVAGVALLIGRVVYLANQSNTQGKPAGVLAAGGVAPKLLATVRLDLPAGAEVRAHALSGTALSVHWVSPTAQGIAVLDMSTGQVGHVGIGVAK
jgi:hypothetical protein